MGNQQEKEQSREFLERKLDPNYGEVAVYLDKNNNLTFTEIKHVLSSDIDAKALEQSITKRYIENNIDRQQLNHRCLIKIKKHEKGEIDDLCSSFMVLSITVEYYSESLSNDFKQRKIHRTTYTEQELLYIIFEISNVCQYMKDQKNEIQDIHPQKVLIDENRNIKYFDQFLETQKINNYFKILFGLRDLEYIAPEQLILLKGEIRTDSTDQELVNVFCLGLMIVSLMSGIRCGEYYNQDTLEYKRDFVSQQIDKFCLKHQFSNSFKQLLSSMLKFHPQDRLNYLLIQDQLQPQSDNISHFLNPPGRQKESQFSSFHTQGSAIKSQVYSATAFDFNEIDQLIKSARQRAQTTLDEVGLDLKLNAYKGSQITIIDQTD
ncbi:unnamed protein product (macronuclear) [Paramecium tetraurelia]|uniref:Protein kinase domain-containing protein n=1 Tax=Paramecium tetraurelia TaxID=5888 RepID=A0BI91_PARTE|nr:uncharacterized protein GSPATT00004630001 [Paramecium tetraurelia]CAK58258.1 unnamed protein product [Paramecium tetraurelia]|eukprot:XP_001425656.1 hypothetical protein (macronuclear) [Paramecium tetraurelia strain d4-2]